MSNYTTEVIKKGNAEEFDKFVEANPKAHFMQKKQLGRSQLQLEVAGNNLQRRRKKHSRHRCRTDSERAGFTLFAFVLPQRARL